MVVVDTSVWLDLFLEDEKRREKAEELMKAVEVVYEPRVFKIELAGALSRRFRIQERLCSRFYRRNID